MRSWWRAQRAQRARRARSAARAALLARINAELARINAGYYAEIKATQPTTMWSLGNPPAAAPLEEALCPAWAQGALLCLNKLPCAQHGITIHNTGARPRVQILDAEGPT